MTEISGIHIYSNLAPVESENSKNTSTSEARLKFTGAYKKSVYCVKLVEGKNRPRQLQDMTIRSHPEFYQACT